MRERLALAVAALTAAVLVLLALVFAWIQNPAPAARVAAPAPPPSPAESAPIAAGRAVYEAQGCAMCHSIAGVGNPRYPLDGVGARRGRDEIGDWIVGAGALEDQLPAGAFRAKQRYQALPREALETLISYVESLTD